MVKVPAYVPRNPRIAIVGEAPGETEAREGLPFQGPSGELLKKFLLSVGIDPAGCLQTNVCKYKPAGNQMHLFFADGGIPKQEVLEGLGELMMELDEAKPNIVLALGNYALWALTGKGRWIDKHVGDKHIRGYSGIQDYRGSLLPSALIKGLKVLPTYHPAYILREGMKDHGIWQADLVRAGEQAAFPEIPRPEKKIYLVQDSPLVLMNYWEMCVEERAPEWEISLDYPTPWEIEHELISAEDEVTLDIEYSPELLCVGMTASSDRAFVYPTGTLKELSQTKKVIEGIQKVNAQNSMFDASILEWHYGTKLMPKVTFDTMVAAHAANIELPKGLDFLASIHTLQPPWKGMVNWKETKKGKRDLPVLYAYNGIDVWVQHQVMEEQKKHELSDPATRRVFDYMMQLLNPLWDMSKRGIRIDLELMARINEDLQGEAAMHLLDLMFLCGHRDILNVRSRKQVADLLYGQFGLPVLKQGKEGPAADDKTLAALSLKASGDAAKAIELIRKTRTAQNLQSKFFALEFDTDGRMRGHYDPTKTVTGRLASRKFYPTGKGTNQQNIPRDKRARRAFLADPGMVFGFADLEKAESFVVAQLTQDPGMLFDHSPGQNAHRNLGAKLFQKAPEELDTDEYYLAKKTRHAGNYMQGPLTFMRNVNQDAHKTGVSVSLAEAKKYINLYKDLHPGLPRWWRETENQLWQTRQLTNLLGRFRTFYGHTQSILPEAVAFVPQSTVGDALDCGLLRLEGIRSALIPQDDFPLEETLALLREWGFVLLQQIHDSVGFQVKARYADQLPALLRRALSIPLTVPKTGEIFTIGVEVQLDLDPARVRAGKANWGDCVPV